ncbi:MAG: amidohydrolase family protein [Phycisphaerales bacterium]
MNLPHGIVRFDALAAADGHGIIAAPASALLRIQAVPGCQRRVIATMLACGRPGEVDIHPAAANAHIIDRRNCVLLPGLVNAHTHLDLTHVGPQPFDPTRGFAGWADMVRQHRLTDPAEIAASVRRGVELNLAAGVVAVGDIAGAVMGKASSAAVQALQQTEMNGVSYVEFFAIGPQSEANVDRAVEVARTCSADKPAYGSVTVGLSPHAPYSVSVASYRRAIERRHQLNVPLMTHLAESPDERELIEHGRGPLRELLERVGVWNDETASNFGQGKSPARHMIDAQISAISCLMAFVHLNDIADDEIPALFDSGTAGVVYCPRASEYFETQDTFGPHRYRKMIGCTAIGLAIGTDSIINLPPGSERPETGQFGPLAEIRRLYRRDRTEPAKLIEMATSGGGAVLNLMDNFSLGTRGQNLIGMIAVPVEAGRDPLEAVLLSDAPPELLLLGTAEGR